jgi:hypothetical protein
MIPGLGGIIDRVTGLFGKTYFLAGFFPVLFLTGVSLLAGYDTSAWIYRQVNGFRALDAGRQALASGALLVVVAMLGFVYWSAGPLWRALLQGSVLPARLHDWLVQDQQRRLERLEQDVKACEDRLFPFRTRHPEPASAPAPAPEAPPPPPPAAAPPPGLLVRLVRAVLRLFRGTPPPPATRLSPAPPPAPVPEPRDATWMDRLRDARVAGENHPTSIGAAPSQMLVDAFDDVRRCIHGLEPVEAAQLDALCTALETELAGTHVAVKSELDRMHVAFGDLATAARARAENARGRALSARRSRFPVNLATVGPTGMANAAELYRDYALARYKMDPEVFWLHLQRAAATDAQFRPILEEARLKLDVSAAMAVACGIGSAWAVAVGVMGHSLPILLITGLGLPLGALLFYRATVANLRVYGETVRATVDLFRVDVLKALHLPRPADSEAERQLWDTLTLSNQLLGEGRLTYDES